MSQPHWLGSLHIVHNEAGCCRRLYFVCDNEYPSWFWGTKSVDGDGWGRDGRRLQNLFAVEVLEIQSRASQRLCYTPNPEILALRQ